jgi:hypothetical protein
MTITTTTPFRIHLQLQYNDNDSLQLKEQMKGLAALLGRGVVATAQGALQHYWCGQLGIRWCRVLPPVRRSGDFLL